MNAFVNKLLEDDFIWTAITSNLPSGSGMSSTDFLRFNCPMCVTVGESADRKQRCGAKRSNEGIGLSCFNCGFKTRYKAGDHLSVKMKAFFKELGMDDLEIRKLAFRASALARVVSDSNVEVADREDRFTPTFPTRSLPEDCLPILDWAAQGCTDGDFLKVAEYAMNRGGNIIDKTMWCPLPQWRDRMILPFTFKENIVGWTGRLVGEATDENPKYMSQVPTDYLHNSDVMMIRKRKYILMPEGVLDAEAIDGISPLGAKLSPRQASWINDSGKTVIVIPDRDSSGQRLIEAALKYKWKVAFPRLSRGGHNWWEENCKDCAEAVKRYGRLYVIRSIIETATDKVLEINVRRKWLI